MNRDAVNRLCATLPGADVSDPFGEGGNDIWKVAGKIFAAIGTHASGISVKTDSVETAEMLKEAGVGTKAPYFYRSWIQVPFDADPEELKHRISTSYRLIRRSLPKKVQATLDPFE